MIGSQIDQYGRTTDDTGATMWVNYEMDDGWRQQWLAMHFGNELQINDFGYLSRNSTNYLNWEVKRRFTDLPKESRYASKDWRCAHQRHRQRPRRAPAAPVAHQPRRAACATAATSTRRSTSTAPASTTCSRAATAWSTCRRTSTRTSSTSGRARATGRGSSEADAFSGGLAGNDKVGYNLRVQPTYFISDAFSVYAGRCTTSTSRAGWCGRTTT